MIRNIPRKYSQYDLMMDLHDKGFNRCYDFLYLPIDRSTSYNIGYAIVNFVDASTAAKCLAIFEGHCFARLQHSSNNKFARISVSRLQGLENNLQHYENTAVAKQKLQLRPVV